MNNDISDLESFADRLMTEKGLEGVDDEVRAQVRTDLLDRLQDRVNAAILANLPSGKIAEFEKTLDSGDQKQIQTFITTAVPNAPEVVAGALMSFRQTYLAG